MAIDENIVIDRTAAQLINAIDITDGASATGENATALGNQSKATSSSSIAIGVLAETKDTGDIAIGGSSKAEKGGQAVGSGAEASGNMALAIGQFSKAKGQNSIAQGNLANATARNAIQIGEGTNNVENTAKIRNTTILDSTGKIPFSALQSGEVVGLAVNSNNHLIVTYADGTTADLGAIGGGGTGDYTQLTNKPSVNGEILIGNKTSAQLGLQSELVSGTNIKTVNSESLLGGGNVEIPIYSYEVDVEFNQSGEIYLQQSTIDYLYANHPQKIIVNITQDGTTPVVRQIFTLIGEYDIFGVKNGLLNYVILNDVEGDENKFNFIQIPTSSSSKLTIREVCYQEKLTFDSTPTANSTNPVTSEGIKTYVDTAVGDIDTALQDLHTALQELISGGGVE